MKIIILTTLCCSLYCAVSAQTRISGRITNSEDKTPVTTANVMLLDRDEKTIIQFTTPDDSGRYALEYSGDADSLVVSVSAMNIKPEKRLIANRTQTLDISVVQHSIMLREVVVKPVEIRRRTDTLDYNVSSFMDDSDRVIADVLKKMPGITVNEDSGTIKYQGKDINRFYIEGLDMLSGSYGVATKNISAGDIQTVQVMENHEPVRARQDISTSDTAAINLVLKDSAKGVTAFTGAIGGGYKPWMWSGEAVMMYFARNFQSLNTYKSNNTGRNIISEVMSLEETSGGSMLGIQIPYTPSLRQSRYMDNTTHAVSLNTLWKLGEMSKVSVNGVYSYDSQHFAGDSETIYYLQDNEVVVREDVGAHTRNHSTSLNIDYEANYPTYMLKNQFTAKTTWHDNSGTVKTPDNNVMQRFKMPSIRLSDNLYYFRNVEGRIFSINSTNSFSSLPATLDVAPMLYGSLFGTSSTYTGLYQELTERKFNSSTSTGFYRNREKWSLGVDLNLIGDISSFDSSLFPVDTAGKTDSDGRFHNDINWGSIKLYVSPRIGYYNPRIIDVNVGIPLNYQYSNVSGSVELSKNKIFASPYLTLRKNLTNNLKMSAMAGWYKSFGGIQNIYTGYIMTDYRTIGNRAGFITEFDSQNYSVDFNYASALQALFGSLSVNCWRGKSNVMYSTDFDGYLSTVNLIRQDNKNDGINISGAINKRISGIATTLKLSGNFSLSNSELMRQTQLIDSRNMRYGAGFSLFTNFTRALRFEYEAAWMRSKSKIRGETSLDPIDAFRQTASISWTIAKGLIAAVYGEHYYNGAIESGSRSMFFADAAVIYRTRLFEYSVNINNLFDTRTYRTAAYGDLVGLVYSYLLRPLSVMFNFRFSFR